MKEIAAREAKNRFGRLLDAAQSAPVRVTKKGRAVGVLMSEAQYDRLRGAAWERLQETVETMRAEADKNGLTDEAPADWLREER
jgi:prevent-host-death family protein